MSAGQVVGTRIICDRESGAPKGYAFVTLQSPAQAQNAMRGMQGYRIMERPITVKVCLPFPVLTAENSCIASVVPPGVVANWF